MLIQEIVGKKGKSLQETSSLILRFMILASEWRKKKGQKPNPKNQTLGGAVSACDDHHDAHL
jgi:hypothetical protein